MTARELLTQAGLQESHWGLRIIAAEERGRFTEQDRDDAENWFSCACGKQDPRIPRNHEGEPKDIVLERYVHATDQEGAHAILMTS